MNKLSQTSVLEKITSSSNKLLKLQTVGAQLTSGNNALQLASKNQNKLEEMINPINKLETIGQQILDYLVC